MGSHALLAFRQAGSEFPEVKAGLYQISHQPVIKIIPLSAGKQGKQTLEKVPPHPVDILTAHALKGKIRQIRIQRRVHIQIFQVADTLIRIQEIFFHLQESIHKPYKEQTRLPDAQLVLPCKLRQPVPVSNLKIQHRLPVYVLILQRQNTCNGIVFQHLQQILVDILLRFVANYQKLLRSLHLRCDLT